MYRSYLRAKQVEAKWTESGTSFGQSTDNAGCFAESVHKLRDVPESSLDEKAHKVALSYFTSSCLQASKPTPDFCAKVPNKFDFPGAYTYIHSQMEKNGVLEKTGAPAVFEEVIKFCGTSANSR